MKILLSIILLSVALRGQSAQAPVIVRQVLGRGFPSNISLYTKRPADLTLVRHGPGARLGHIWLQTVGTGLLVVGEVGGPRPNFAHNQKLILEKDHVEIWLADGKDPNLPPLGWGNQFDQITLPNGADSCADWARHGAAETPAAPAAPAAEKRCRSWTDTQSRYRPFFRRLFMRQWVVTPDYAVESFATPAFDEIAGRFLADKPNAEETPSALKPVVPPQMWFGPGKNGAGYSFEILIPFSAFPPLSTTDLRALRLLVEVFNPPSPGSNAIAYSTSAPSRIYAKPETFNTVRLEPPQQFKLTPCQMPLAGKDKYGDAHPAWFIPKAAQADDFQSDAFILVNDGVGYQYEPDALSPVARPIHFFGHEIGGPEWVCGPYLSYRRGDQTLAFDLDVNEDGFDAHRLPGGDLLIKVGPRVYGSEFGSGTCGACPRTDLRIFRLGADLRLREMLELGGIIDNGSGASQDFSLSRDWSRIVQFDQAAFDDQGNPGPWSSTTWCRGEFSYGKCDHQDKVDPPDPPLLKDLRTAD